MHCHCAVRKRSASTQRHSDKDALSNFFLRGASSDRAFRMHIDTVGTLGNMRGRHGDEFFHFHAKSAFLECLRVKFDKRFEQIRAQTTKLLQRFHAIRWIEIVRHNYDPLWNG